MCVIYAGTVYLQCSGCGTIDLASSRTFPSIIQCEADDRNLCPLGPQRLETHQHITLYDLHGCWRCQRASAEQHRSIYSILRPNHGIGRRLLVRTRRTGPLVRHPAQRNGHVNAFLSSGTVTVGDPSTNIAPSCFPQASPSQQPVMQYSSFHAAHQSQQDIPIADPFLGYPYPPLPDLAEDPDFQEMLNMSTTLAAEPAPALQGQGEMESVPASNNHASVLSWLDEMPDTPGGSIDHV